MDKTTAHPVFGKVTRRIISNTRNIAPFKHLIEILSFQQDNIINRGVGLVGRLTQRIAEGTVDVFRHGNVEYVRIHAVRPDGTRPRIEVGPFPPVPPVVITTHWEDYNNWDGPNTFWNKVGSSPYQRGDILPHLKISNGELVVDTLGEQIDPDTFLNMTFYEGPIFESPIPINAVSFKKSKVASGTGVPTEYNPTPGGYAVLDLGFNETSAPGHLQSLSIIIAEYPKNAYWRHVWGLPDGSSILDSEGWYYDGDSWAVWIPDAMVDNDGTFTCNVEEKLGLHLADDYSFAMWTSFNTGGTQTMKVSVDFVDLITIDDRWENFANTWAELSNPWTATAWNMSPDYESFTGINGTIPPWVYLEDGKAHLKIILYDPYFGGISVAEISTSISQERYQNYSKRIYSCNISGSGTINASPIWPDENSNATALTYIVGINEADGKLVRIYYIHYENNPGDFSLINLDGMADGDLEFKSDAWYGLKTLGFGSLSHNMWDMSLRLSGMTIYGIVENWSTDISMSIDWVDFT